MATCRMQTASRTASTASWAASVRVVQPRCATAARAATLTRQTRRSASHASQASTSRCRACRNATTVRRVRTVRRAQARICFVQRAASVARRRQRVRTTARIVLPVHRAPPGRRSPPRVRRVRSHLPHNHLHFCCHHSRYKLRRHHRLHHCRRRRCPRTCLMVTTHLHKAVMRRSTRTVRCRARIGSRWRARKGQAISGDAWSSRRSVTTPGRMRLGPKDGARATTPTSSQLCSTRAS